MTKATAQFKLYYITSLIAIALCAGWTLGDAWMNGANAVDAVTLALLVVAGGALYLSHRQPNLAGADACDEDDIVARWREEAQWTPEQRAEAQAKANQQAATIVAGLTVAATATAAARPGAIGQSPQEYRQGDWVTFLPYGAKVVDLEQREDGTRWVVYQLATDHDGMRRKSVMACIPQRAADTPAVRAEFDSPEPAGLVVEEVGDEDDGYTPMSEEASPGVIGDAQAVPYTEQQVRRIPIDRARLTRQKRHWLEEAEASGKLQGGPGADYLRHILSGVDAEPIAQYLEHAKGLVERAKEGQLLLEKAIPDTPLAQSLVLVQKMADEGASLALLLVDRLSNVEAQRDELACRLIQAMPTAVDRNRANSFYEGQADEAEEAAVFMAPDAELVSYRLLDADKLEGIDGHTFWTRADVHVPLMDLHTEGSTRLRVIDADSRKLLGYVYRNPERVPGTVIPD